MKTKISNFFVLVVIFLLGWFLVFFFSVQKTETVFEISNRWGKKHQHKKEREKNIWSRTFKLGTFFERPTCTSGVKNATNKNDFHHRGVTRVVGWAVRTRSFSHLFGHGLGRLSAENLE